MLPTHAFVACGSSGRASRSFCLWLHWRVNSMAVYYCAAEREMMDYDLALKRFKDTCDKALIAMEEVLIFDLSKRPGLLTRGRDYYGNPTPCRLAAALARMKRKRPNQRETNRSDESI
jgi:ribosomal protein S21